MKYSSYSKMALVVGMLYFASACQFVPKQAQELQITEQAAEELQVSAPINPYLLNRPQVSAQVKENYAAALLAMDMEDWGDAEERLLRITQNHPELSGPYITLALLYKATGKVDRVEPFFLKAIQANPNNVYGYNLYAIFLREQGEFAKAESTYLDVLQLWPEYREATVNLAILYDLYIGNLEQALRYYENYQNMLEQPDRQVAGWIVDAKRRLSSMQQASLGVE